MRGKLLWALLAVSLATNVFLVGGALFGVYGTDHADRRPGVTVESVAKKLELSAEQRRGLADLRAMAQERRKAMRGQRGELRDSFLSTLAQPTFDRDQILALIESRSAQRRDFLVGMAEELHSYLATLTPDQRGQFFAMARERGFMRGLFGRPRKNRN